MVIEWLIYNETIGSWSCGLQCDIYHVLIIMGHINCNPIGSDVGGLKKSGEKRKDGQH